MPCCETEKQRCCNAAAVIHEIFEIQKMEPIVSTMGRIRCNDMGELGYWGEM